MHRIKIYFFLAGLIVIVIIGYFVKNRSNDSIVETAKKIASKKQEIELLTSELDSVWLESRITTSIILQIHDKTDYLKANCYSGDTLVLEKKIPRAYYINSITSNDIITIYKYTKEYLLLRRFIKAFSRDEFSLIFFKTKVPTQNEAIQFIQTNFKNVKSVKMISNEVFLFSQLEN